MTNTVFGYIMQSNFWDMGVWCLGITNALRNKCSMLHYPPLYSTLTLSRNIISKIFLFYKHPISPIQTPLQGYFRHFQAVYKQLSLGYTCHMNYYFNKYSDQRVWGIYLINNRRSRDLHLRWGRFDLIVYFIYKEFRKKS